MMTLMVVAVLAATPGDVVKTSEVEETVTPPQWAVQLRFGLPSFGLVGGVGELGGVAGVGFIGGLGGLGGSTPPAGLLVERAMNPHWSVTLGVDAAGAAFDGTPMAFQLGASPGVRWYANNPFQGAWVGPRVGVGGSWASASFLQTDGTVLDVRSSSLSVSPDVLIGWTWRLNSRFLLTLAGGPSLTWARVTATANTQPSASSSLTTGLHAFAAAGLAL